MYLNVLTTDQLSLLSWASSSSWKTRVCSGSLLSFSFHRKMAASVEIKTYYCKLLFTRLTRFIVNFISIHFIYWDSPSPPEARNSPLGLNRTTFTAFVCLTKLDRKSTTAFPSGPRSTLHICSRIKGIHSQEDSIPNHDPKQQLFNRRHSLLRSCPHLLRPVDVCVHLSCAGNPDCRLVLCCAMRSHRLPPSF